MQWIRRILGLKQAKDDKPKFAFLIHPRIDVRGDIAKAVHAWLRWIPLPDKWLEWLLHKLPPVASGKIVYQQQHVGYIIFVPWSAKLMQAKQYAAARAVLQAVSKAKRLNCRLVGLGALTAPITAGGLKLVNQVEGVGITNGNALTAAITLQAVESILTDLPFHPDRTTIAVVGATGSTGSGIAKFLVHQGRRILLIGRPRGDNLDDVSQNPKLAQLYRRLSHINPATQATMDMQRLQEADVVIVTTSAAEVLIRREHLKIGAIVYDDTQPRNTDPKLAQHDDILVVDGGWVYHPQLEITVNIDLPSHHAYACLIETMLLHSQGDYDDYCIGNVDYEQIVRMQQLFQQSQFELAHFRSFGKVITAQEWSRIADTLEQGQI